MSSENHDARGVKMSILPPAGGGFNAKRRGVAIFGDPMQKRVSNRLEVFLREAKGAASTRGQASMRERGPHQTPVAMSVQSQEQVA